MCGVASEARCGALLGVLVELVGVGEVDEVFAGGLPEVCAYASSFGPGADGADGSFQVFGDVAGGAVEVGPVVDGASRVGHGLIVALAVPRRGVRALCRSRTGEAPRPARAAPT